MSQKHEYFGKYILLEKMAAGGMAEVFLARAPGAGGIAKFVAIKRILPQYSDNKEFVEMFKDEAKIAINLSHSNIVSIYEFGVEQGQFFLVMDFVKGRNIRQILNKMKQSEMQFSVDQIVYMCKEIAGGLDHAHRCLDGTTGKPLNITHRDMSPQNVMVSFEGEIKIIDFGIAKAETQMETTRAGTLKGKFGYMSPEQAEGQPVDLRTDIFSLGTVLWELLANDRLFIANNEINTLRKIRDCNVPSLLKINPEVHPELERVCLKALTKDRNLRYQTAAAFHRDLSRFLNRHYPDFSPHDFAMFIKSLYADEILELNNRLVEYSKIPFKDPEARRPPRIAVASQSQYQMNRTDQSGQQGSDNQQNPDYISSDQMLGNVQNAIKLQKNRMTGYNNQHIQKKSDAVFNESNRLPDSSEESTEVSTTTSGLQSEIIGNPTPHPTSFAGQRNRIAGTYTGTSPSPIQLGTSKARRIAIYSFYSVAALFSYFVFTAMMPGLMAPLNNTFSGIFEAVGLCNDYENNGLVKELREFGMDRALCTPPGVPQQAGNTSSSKESPRDQSSTTPPDASPNPIGIVINSSPSGAEIYINGTSTYRTTPDRVSLIGGKPIKLELRKRNYEPYVYNSFVPSRENPKITAVMQKIQIGYLDIDVDPPRYAQVFINKVKVESNNLPILRHKVPAGQEILITAKNPVTNDTASKRVILRDGERQSIVLRLNRRSPSGSNRYRR